MRLVHYSCALDSLLVSIVSDFLLLLGFLVVTNFANEITTPPVANGEMLHSHQNQELETSGKSNYNLNGTRRVEQCENGALSRCWNQIPPFPDQGIPSSHAGVATACRAFEKGMRCVHNWTKQCLHPDAQKRIMESVRGAHETFAFLCRDPKFRDEFLSHSPCYKQISVHWDECANRFVAAVRALRPVHYDNPVNLCCIRRAFMRCVSEVSNHYCSKNATIFLLKMAETLVRTAMRGNTPQPRQCDSKAFIEECDRRHEGSDTGVSLRDNSSPVFVLFLCYLSKTLLIDTLTPL